MKHWSIALTIDDRELSLVQSAVRRSDLCYTQVLRANTGVLRQSTRSFFWPFLDSPLRHQ